MDPTCLSPMGLLISSIGVTISGMVFGGLMMWVYMDEKKERDDESTMD